MKQLIPSLFIFLFALPVFGQKDFRKNTLYLELGGNGLIGSINYERQVFKKPGLGIHAGLGFYGRGKRYLTVPIGVNYLIGIKSKHNFLMVGMGATYTKAEVLLYAVLKRPSGYVQTNFWNFIPSIGYRGVTNFGLMFQAKISPVYNHDGDFLPYMGIGLGYSF